MNFFEKSIPFLLLPILTRELSIEDVGLYVLYQTIIEVIMPIMTLNIDNTILLYFYNLSKKQFKDFFANGIIVFVSIFLIVLGCFYLFKDPIGEMISFPPKWFVITGLVVFFRFLNQNRQSLWRINYKIKNYSLFTVGLSIVNNLTGLLLVLYSDFGWTGMIVGHLTGHLIFGCFSAFTFYKEGLLKLKERIYSKEILKVSYPIALHRLGIWLGSSSNKMIIAGIMGTYATGSYGVGAVFAGVVTITEDAVSKAIIPHIYEKLRKKDEAENRSIVSLSYKIYILLLGVSISVFFVGTFGMDIIFGEDYGDSKIILLPIIISAYFKGLYKLHVHYIFFTKKTLKVTKITFSTGIFNLILSYFLVVNYGLIGAAYSLLIVNFIQYLLSFYVGNKLMPMPWFNKLKERS